MITMTTKMFCWTALLAASVRAALGCPIMDKAVEIFA